MLQKIKSFSDKSKDIYANLITGVEGTLSEVGRVDPSDRVNKRHGLSGTPKVRSNRKTTKGRNIYYQTVMDANQMPLIKENGKHKAIKHVQESFNAIQRKTTLLTFYDKIEVDKHKWHNDNPEYKSKKS